MRTDHRDIDVFAISGFAFLLGLLILAGALAVLAGSVAALALLTLGIFCLPGFFILIPNEAVVFLLFGEYRGVYKESGFFWTNPFYTGRKVSLRQRNTTTQRLKVNDLQGNPIEIAAVISWHVAEPARAVLDVESYTSYLDVQCETALRQVASRYAYDRDEGDPDQPSLLDSREEISGELRSGLQEQVGVAGIVIDSMQISHLAYAAEIASAMLRRQQALAVVAARQALVRGAIAMVEDTVRELGSRGIVHLSDPAKAQLVTSMLTVLVGEGETQPMVQVGKLDTGSEGVPR